MDHSRKPGVSLDLKVSLFAGGKGVVAPPPIPSCIGLVGHPKGRYVVSSVGRIPLGSRATRC